LWHENPDADLGTSTDELTKEIKASIARKRQMGYWGDKSTASGGGWFARRRRPGKG